MTALIHSYRYRVAARAHRGMWIADCLACDSALALNRFEPSFACWDCGAYSEVVWPPEEVVLGVERLLLMRPHRKNQNWNPGETLTDLMWENGQHGIFNLPDEIMGGFGVAPLIVEDGRIRTDRLPLTRQREFKAIGT